MSCTSDLTCKRRSHVGDFGLAHGLIATYTDTHLVAFKIIEGFFAVVALVHGFAGGTSKLAE